MKKLIYLIVIAFIASSVFVSCDDNESSSPFKTITLGAQNNQDINGFYSINKDKTYNLKDAAANAADIDLLCYYDASKNLMTLSSPGANLDGVFTGENDPEAWTVADTTFFSQVDAGVLSIEQFDLLTSDNDLVQSLFDSENAKRKAKQLTTDDIYAFKTEGGQYGLFKIVSVTEGLEGFVEFTYIIKE